MWRFNLTTQIFVLLVVPALAGLGSFFLAAPGGPPAAQIMAICFLVELLGIGVFGALTVSRLKTTIDNGYRYANGLPERPLPAGEDEISKLGDVLKKVYVNLESTSNRYRTCLSNSADVICTVSPAFIFLMCSDASSRLWRYDPIFITGRPVGDFLPTLDYQSFTEAAARSRQSSPVEVELRLKRRDGSLSWTLWSISWVEKEAAYFCVVKDITDKKQIEQLKNEFLNTVSHDLRTPLLSIGAFLEVLSKGAYGSLNEKGTTMTAATQGSVTRLIGLVGDLLDLEKMEDGKLELDICELPVVEIVNDAWGSLSSYAEKRNIAMTKAGDLEQEVLADPQRLVQVIQNLLSNAVKFSPPDSTISITAQAEEKMMRIEIADQGPGIPADKQEYIFDRFRQLPQSEGTGLGLAICRAIVMQHQGTIGVTSKDGQGSKFWVRIPLAGKDSDG